MFFVSLLKVYLIWYSTSDPNDDVQGTKICVHKGLVNTIKILDELIVKKIF